MELKGQVTISIEDFEKLKAAAEQKEYCVKVLKGVASNDSQFIYIAQMNESDDMWTPENWIKANPILEYDRDALQNMIPIAATAKEMGGSTLRDFIVKQLNMWIQWTNDVYIKDMDVWTRAAVKKTLADFRGQKEELEKAQAAAKKTLKTEPDTDQEGGDDNGDRTNAANN